MDTKKVKSKYQKFETLEINREDIKNAPYNPRKITAEAKRKLKESLKEDGLVAPITWNKRTGNIVGGHQRIAALDSLHKTTNYSIDVAAIDVDDVTEIKLNVKLNNSSLQGEFDFDILKEISEDFGLDFQTDMMFDKADTDFMFGFMEKESGSAEDMESFKKDRDAYAEKTSSEIKTDEDTRIGKADFCLTLIFNSTEEKHQFLRSKEIDPTLRNIAACKVI